MNGYGIAALVNGGMQGYKFGKEIRNDIDNRAVRDEYSKGIEAAKTARQADINASLTPVESGNPAEMRDEAAALRAQPAASTGIMTQQNPPTYQQAQQPEINTSGALAGAGLPEKSTAPTGKFMVGGKEYANRDEALKAADANADSLMTYFNRDAGPKIRETLMSQGKVDQAEAWGKYLEDGATKQGMKYWAQGVANAEAGNYEKAADLLMKAQNVQGYGTGLKIAGIKPRKAADGTPQGITVEYEGEDGEKSTKDFASVEELTQMGVAALNPMKQFEYWVAQKKRADDIRAEAAKQKAEDTRDANKQTRSYGFYVLKAREKGRIDRENKAAELNDRARLGIGTDSGSDTRASMSKSDREYRLHDTLLRTNTDYAAMTPAEQAAYRKQQLDTMPYASGIGGMTTTDGVPLLEP